MDNVFTVNIKCRAVLSNILLKERIVKMPSNKRIAVWLSEKKLQKMNWQEFETICNENGFEVFRVGNPNLYLLFLVVYLQFLYR